MANITCGQPLYSKPAEDHTCHNLSIVWNANVFYKTNYLWHSNLLVIVTFSVPISTITKQRRKIVM